MNERKDEPDDEINLPPIDADDDAAEEPAGDLEDELLGDLDDGADPLDDRTADVDAGVDVDELDDDADEGAEGETDVGPLDEGMIVDEERAAGDEHADDHGDHDGVDLDEHASGDDGGAEGTSERPEDEVDEGALPELDADAEGDGDGDELAELLLAEAGEQAIPWARARWTRLEGAGAEVPCAALSIANGRVLAAGEVLILVEEGAIAARTLAFGGGAAAVALSDDAILVATSRGQILSSADGGATATQIAPRRPGTWAEPIELAGAPGRFWIHAGGELSCLGALDQPMTPVLERGVVAATSSAGVLVAIAEGADGPSIQRLRGDDEGLRSTPLDGAARRLVDERRGAPLRIAAAAGGRCVAITDGASLLVSRDDGRSFSPVALGRVDAIAFMGDDPAASLLAVCPGPGGAAHLVEVQRSGEAVRLAEIPGACDEEAATAIGWDPSREAAWLACRTGLCAYGSARRH